ncbi:MAG: penicillin-binding protein 1A [Bacillota bacterium]
MKRKYQYTLAVILLILSLGFGIFIGAITYIVQETPDISNYKGAQETTRIYSADGDILSRFFTEDRVYVPLKRIPADLTKAVVAIEDTNFYSHNGIDVWGIVRALITNIRQGRSAQGGSTITQQLARNALLSFEKTYYRKIQEAYLALQFEHLYTKPEILEMYLNEIFMGHSAYGVQTAARQYFDKNVWELTLSESALIAGLPQSPNNYSPFNNMEASLKRRNRVLQRMKKIDFITEEEYEQARNEEIDIEFENEDKETNTVYFENYIKSQLKNILEDIYGSEGSQMIYGGGLQVYTTLDLEMQKYAEKAYQQALDKKEGYIPSLTRDNSKDKLQPQGALVSLEAETGAIRAMIGGRGNDQFNRAVQSKRQPGSAFKPFVYTTALQQDYSPASIINDIPVILETDDGRKYAPRNYDNRYKGFISARTGLAESINLAAVKLARDLGINNIINVASQLGISTFEESDKSDSRYSVALGGLNKGVIPLEIASAYSVFASNGVKKNPFAIEKILDSRDNVIYRAKPNKKVVLDEDTSFLINSMLESVITDGTGWRIDQSIDHPVAGKTGTTNKNTDAWFVGYTPRLVTAIWIGEDTNLPMDKEHGYSQTIGSGHAVMLWRDYMKQVLDDQPKQDFTKPKNIEEVEIDPVTGLLPNDSTPETITEYFRSDNKPEDKNNLHETVETIRIDQETGKLATENCPEDNIVKQHYFENSGIRVNNNENTMDIAFSQKNVNSENRFTGTYEISPHHPIQKIDSETGLPATSLENEPVYEKIPQEICELHEGETIDDEVVEEKDSDKEVEEDEDEEDGSSSIIKNIWDYLKTKEDEDENEEDDE